MQYTEEQIIRANQTDLVSFLSAQGEQLGKSGKEYRWKKHDSVTVSGNRWYRHSQGRGGYPVDFVMEFYNATFPEAVKMLIEGGRRRQEQYLPAPSPTSRLPEKEGKMIESSDIRQKTEGIGKEYGGGNGSAVGIFMKKKKHHNVVFVGRDADGIPRYAHCRELVKQNTGEMWLNLINLTDSVTEGRIISCLCLKQPLICFLLSNHFPKTGKSGAT